MYADCTPSPCSSTEALPETQTLRCSGVEPIDGEMFALSPVRFTVTTVPSARVCVMLPPGNGTNVSAFAAPTEHKPMVAAAAAPTAARRTPFLRLMIIVPSQG